MDDSIIFKTALYKLDDIYAMGLEQEIRFCCKCNMEIEKEGYTYTRLNMKPFWIKKIHFHLNCWDRKIAELHTEIPQKPLLVRRGYEEMKEILLN